MSRMPLLRFLASASALLAFLPSFAAQVTFNASQNIATGFQHLSGYAVGDFNGDGKPDLAFTDLYDKRVVVYLNNGTGGFAAPISTVLNIPNTTGSIAVGDIDEDGKQDLVVGTVSGIQTTYILLSKGDGAFAPSGTLPKLNGFVKGLLVDVNGDKHLDFVATGNGSLYSALGDGKGNFSEKPIVNLGGPFSLLTALAVTDFNRDGKPDLVVSTYANPGLGDGDIRYFPGLGDGSFGAPTTFKPLGTTTYDYVGSADFNADGKADLAFSVAVLGAIAPGNGDGTFQFSSKQLTIPTQSTRTNFPSNTQPPPVAIADLDGNGAPDFVVASTSDNRLYATLNDGTGSFLQANPDFQADIQPNTFFAITADLNGDGLPDIITGSYTTNVVQVFFSVPVKITPTATVTSTAAQSIPGAPVTLSAKVTGIQTPTGSVIFNDGTTSLGQVALDAGGQASITTSSLATGIHPITAIYSGDFKFNGTTSTALAQSIVDFSVSVANGSQTISSGGTASYSLSVAGAAGLTGVVMLSCTGLPSGYLCPTVTANLGMQPVTATLTVSPSTHAHLRRNSSPLQLGYDTALAVLPFSLLCSFGLRRRVRNAGLLCAITFTAGCIWLSGCGGSSSPATTAFHGTTTFTINAATLVGSQSLSHQTTATLTVQ